MANANLHAVVRIKTMARAAAQTDAKTPEVGAEVVAAFERLRLEAADLNERAGWGDADSFEVPALVHEHVPATHAQAMPVGGHDAYQEIAKGRRAIVLLGQLAAWAEGHQEAFELEAKLRADAEAKANAAAKQALGFR